MSVASKAAFGCMTAMVLCMVFAAMTVLMLRDGVKPRRDLGLERQNWRWALLPAALTAWAVWVMLKQSAILDQLPRR